jgi:hypothetical protein
MYCHITYMCICVTTVTVEKQVAYIYICVCVCVCVCVFFFCHKRASSLSRVIIRVYAEETVQNAFVKRKIMLSARQWTRIILYEINGNVRANVNFTNFMRTICVKINRNVSE